MELASLVMDKPLRDTLVPQRRGESLTRVPGSDGLLRDLAGEVRRGLSLTWARVTLEADGGPLRVVTDGAPSGEPVTTVPIEYQGAVLGSVECGPRSDGPLLAEDRRLLAYFAAQAAVGVHNLHLASELSRRVEEIRVQAAELAASRDRVVAGQDAERRRIQRIEDLSHLRVTAVLTFLRDAGLRG